MLWHEPDTHCEVLNHKHGLELPSPEVGKSYFWNLRIYKIQLRLQGLAVFFNLKFEIIKYKFKYPLFLKTFHVHFEILEHFRWSNLINFQEWDAYYWKETGECFEQESRGPCQEGQYFGYNTTTRLVHEQYFGYNTKSS